MNKKGSTHLTKEEREVIEEKLNEGQKCKEIAAILGKDERTVSREVQKRRNKIKNERYGLYGKKDDTECSTLKRFPFTCHTCPKRKYCCKEYKYFYKSDIAQENYEIILRDSRIGLDITPEDKAVFDAVLKEGIDKGQSIHHIVSTNRDILRYSERSAYRLIDRRQTFVQPIDLRHKVKLKPRKHYIYKDDCKEIRKGRTYADFITLLACNPSVPFVQMDTVEGKSEGKHQCFLTLHFPLLHFMLVFVLKSRTKENVSNAFASIRKRLGNELYKKLFPVILTDRGSEFCDPAALEIDPLTGEQLSHVFFCDSYASYQKGSIEENHTLLRYIVPKGVLFDDLSQVHADLITSHINSFVRKSISTSPYQLALAFWGKDILSLLNCSYISPADVNLTPDLLK